MVKLAEELTFCCLKTPKFINYLTGMKPNKYYIAVLKRLKKSPKLTYLEAE